MVYFHDLYDMPSYMAYDSSTKQLTKSSYEHGNYIYAKCM